MFDNLLQRRLQKQAGLHSLIAKDRRTAYQQRRQHCPVSIEVKEFVVMNVDGHPRASNT